MRGLELTSLRPMAVSKTSIANIDLKWQAYSNATTQTAVGSPTGGAIITFIIGGKSVQLNCATGSDTAVRDPGAFRFYEGDTSSNTAFGLTGASQRTTDKALLGTVTKTAAALPASESGKWQHITIDFDFSAGTIDAVIEGAEEKREISTEITKGQDIFAQGISGVEVRGSTKTDLRINFADNIQLTPITKKDTAAITPTTATYDKYSGSENHKAIEGTLSGDYTLTALKNGETTLTENTDYTVNGNTYTILTSYLDTLTTNATLTFNMDGGTNPTLTIAVTDTTPVSTEDVIKKVVLEQVMDGETATNQVNVYLEGYTSNGSHTNIENLVAVDLDFAITEGFAITGFTAADAEWTYEITDTGSYLIHEKGMKDGASDLDGQKILLGTLTLEGYGSGTITAGADSRAVQQRSADGKNIVISSVAETATLTVTVAVPTKTLTVKVTFPNNVVDNAAAYQDMKATISGGDLMEEIVMNFGINADDEEAIELEDQTYTFEQELTENTAYTVTITGAGYRTARYSVNMAEDKELNFWNNVKDALQVVEIGKETSAVLSNFLAGDIVGDNNINIYDLSAVVSYFGTINVTNTASDYAKYDLNRDGVIDSKDVALVLVSWNN